jgi:hypothetical protein
MNAKLLLISGLVILLVLAIIVTILMGMSGGINLPGRPDPNNNPSNPKTPEVYTDFNTSVVPVESIDTVTIPTEQGSVQTTDITKLPEIKSIGDGTYSLDGTRSDKNAGFSLVYYKSDNSYAIAILNEPIAQNRIAASKYLLELLQISEADACKLNVYIGTIYSVNQQLAGQNLGLSFCPGAIQL